MPIKVNNIPIEEFVEQASELTRTQRFTLIKKLILGLKVTQLKELQSALDRELTDAILEEEKGAKIEYKFVNNNFYAYIEKWGREDPEAPYLGRMDFLPGVKYNVISKETNKVETVVGLGLERKDDQLLLKNLELLPYPGIKSYVFYDANLLLPRNPAEQLAKVTFSRRKYQIEAIGWATASELGNISVSTLR